MEGTTFPEADDEKESKPISLMEQKIRVQVLLVLAIRTREPPLGLLPVELIHHILSFLPPVWLEDTCTHSTQHVTISEEGSCFSCTGTGISFPPPNGLMCFFRFSMGVDVE